MYSELGINVQCIQNLKYLYIQDPNFWIDVAFFEWPIFFEYGTVIQYVHVPDNHFRQTLAIFVIPHSQPLI